MTIGAYPIGTLVSLGAEFRVDRVLTDPTDLTLTVRDPDGTLTTYDSGDITRMSVGRYRVLVRGDIVGAWSYRYEGTGAADAVSERQFVIEHSLVLS